MKHTFFHPLKNNRGVALVFIVLLFATAATASIMLLAVGGKIKGMEREGETQARLDETRKALQNYYLIHYDLPDPSTTTPVNSVPTVSLNLPQKYRFDSNGQMIRYDRLPASGAITTVRNIAVHGNDPENLVGAVLVAPGPDKTFSAVNLSSPYDEPTGSGGDDLVVAVSLEAEALKVANHTVNVLQQAAKSYDSIFHGKNNDLDTLYYPPETRWVDITEPNAELNWEQVSTDPVTGDPIYDWVATGDYHQNYSLTTYTSYIFDGTDATSEWEIPGGDEYVEPVYLSGRNSDNHYFAESIIDEDEYSPAEGGGGEGCVRIAEVESDPVQMWTNDPSRGIASLDEGSCTTSVDGIRQPGYDLAVAYGLNLAKLGYDVTSNSLLDPWGEDYRWGTPADAVDWGEPLTTPKAFYNTTETRTTDRDRDPHYWSFYSFGPDGVNGNSDDILPTADRISGKWSTPEIANPIP